MTASFRLVFVSLVLSLLVGGAVAQPQPESTRVVVRAVSNDAKLLQDPVGGAFIRIVNAETGAVMAEGTQRGASVDLFEE